MSKSIPEQLRFPPVDGFTLRADFEGGALFLGFRPPAACGALTSRSKPHPPHGRGLRQSDAIPPTRSIPCGDLLARVAIVKSGVYAVESSSGLIDFRHLDSILKFHACDYLGKISEST